MMRAGRPGAANGTRESNTPQRSRKRSSSIDSANRQENALALSPPGSALWQGVTVMLVFAITTFIGVWSVAREAHAAETWPQQVLEQGVQGVAFVDQHICVQCHPQQFQDWSGSHHDWAMQPATDQTVLGDFTNVSFTHFGVTSRFFKKDGKFFVHTEGPDGGMADFEIVYTFGFDPLQQYLIAFPGGRLQNLSIAWDTHKRRWFHLYPGEKIAPDDPLHWTGRAQTWNVACADCHSTDLQKNYDPTTDTYQTTWAAINVSCQACHGPGAQHVRWAQERREDHNAPYDKSGLLVNFTTLDARGQVEACAHCHARRHRISAANQYGRSLLDDMVPTVLREGLYHPDGQILDEVYVYGSFLQSKMYQRGVRCTDCHNPHSLKLRAEGNALCVQCHQQQPDQRFPSLPSKAYDTPAHHFHPATSSGAQCANCHMPTQTYMVVDPRRDHSFRIPRPDLSVKLGTPNACTMCHLGRTAQWAADVVATWYGPQRRQEAHYADTLAAGRAGRPEAVPLLSQLAAATTPSTMVRATALDLLQRYGTAGISTMVAALHDADPLVRATAVGGLDRMPPQPRLAAVAPLLTDPIHAVRLEAARVLASVPPALFDTTQRQAFETALTEFKAAQRTMADTPGAHLNLGVLHTSLGQPDVAEQAYRTAIKLDPFFLPARFNLVHLYNQTGRNANAEQVLRDGITRVPTEGELYYSLGLLLAESQRLDEAASTLAKATTLLPNRPRVRYNYALVLQHLNRPADAEAAMRAAHQLDTRDPDIVYALVVLYMQQSQWERALPYAHKLLELAPGAPGPQQLLQHIQNAIGSGKRPPSPR